MNSWRDTKAHPIDFYRLTDRKRFGGGTLLNLRQYPLRQTDLLAFLAASKHIYCCVCVCCLRVLCFASALACVVLSCECKAQGRRVPTPMTVRLAGGHSGITMRAPAADLIKVSQSYSSWLKTPLHTQTYRHLYKRPYWWLLQLPSPSSSSGVSKGIQQALTTVRLELDWRFLSHNIL